MKKSLLLPVLMALGLHSYGQEENTVEVEFDNGEKTTFTYLYDDPSSLFKLYGGVGLSVAPSGEFLSFVPSFEGGYWINDRMWVEAKMNYNLLSGIIGEQLSNSLYYKKSYDLSPMFHYSILSGDKVRKKNVPVHTTYSGSVQQVYQMNLPRRYRHHLMADVGFTNFRRDNFLSLTPNAGFQDDKGREIRMLNSSGTSLNIGLSYFRSNSLGFKTGWGEGSYFGTFRVYGFGMVGVSKAANVILDGSDDDPVSDNSIYVEPDFSVIGWRAGMEATFTPYYATNKVAQMYRFEIGQNPGYVVGEDITPFFLTLGYGIQFGTR